ncbi:MAG: hypothetical protein OEY49_16380, partial [Candidatus Heimdallarchaeota archaeon]|nr:hypothetical protein [Candidatus Heimdallarchaeota archaeon]
MGVFNIFGLINNLARILNKWIMTTIALIIAVLLFTIDNNNIIIFFWSLFILFSTIFTINGFFLISSFKAEVRKLKKLGKPVKGVIGFEELTSSIMKSFSQSIFVTFASILSFVIYLAYHGDYLGLGESNFLLNPLALAMAFVAISVMFLVEYPEDPSFTPGGLIGYYEPDSYPLVLDNLLSDVFLTYMDPATFLKYDEWSAGILNYLKPEFENDETSATRMERAREKILLLGYLSYSNKEAFTKEIIEKELKELFGDNLSDFLKGKGIGLEFREITSILQKIEDRAPEPFRLVDRLMINLTDNYEKFISDDLYFTVSSKTNQGSVSESTGIVVFLLNKTNKDDRELKITLETDEESIHPASQGLKINLDPMTDPFPKE